MLASRISWESCRSWGLRQAPLRSTALKTSSRLQRAPTSRSWQVRPSSSLTLSQHHQKRHRHQYGYRWNSSSSSNCSEYHHQAPNHDIHLGEVFARLSGIAGVGTLSAAAIQIEYPRKEEKLELPADPWLLTNTEPQTEPEPPLTYLGQFLQFIWNAFELVTGIRLIKHIARSIIAAIGQIKHAMIPSFIDIFLNMAILGSPAGQPVETEKIVSELAKAISAFASTARPGEVDALSKEMIETLLSSKAMSLLPSNYKRSLPLGQKHWAEPYTSAITNEELYLGVNYASFLAKSRRDGAIYHIEGYFALTADSVPAPLVIYSKKAAHSQSELMQGKITDVWRAHLSNPWKRIGLTADAEQDLSTEFRAMFMPFDLRRLLADEDWLSYIGAPHSKAKFTRKKSSTAGLDWWVIAAKSSNASDDSKSIFLPSIDVRIFNEPKSAVADIEVTFPETADSLEDRVLLQAPVLMCSRWCTYVEKNPILADLVGKEVRLVSSPILQAFVAPGVDFNGSMFDCKFDVAGSKGSATLHFKVARDSVGDGRSPVAPVISVWAETSMGRLDIYRNSRKRYTVIHEWAVSIPISTDLEPSPYLSSDLSIGVREYNSEE